LPFNPLNGSEVPSAGISSTMSEPTGTAERKLSRIQAIQSCILAGLVSGTIIGSLNYSFGVFVPVWSEVFDDWSRTEINVAFSISQIVSSLFAPIAGHYMDKYSVRPVVSLSLVLSSSGYLVLSLTKSLPILYIAYFLVGIGYPGAALLGPGKVVGQWFTGKRRGRVMGFVSSSNNIGGLIMTQLSTFIILKSNFRWAAAFFCILLAFLSIIYFIFIRLPASPDKAVKVQANQSRTTSSLEDCDTEDVEVAEPQPKQKSCDRSLVNTRIVLTSPKFLLTTLGYFCAFWTYTGVFSNLIPALIAEGFTEQEGANIQSAVAISGIFSKLICGFLSERLGARITLMLVMSVQAVTLIVFKLLQGPGLGYWISCIIYGLSFGGVGVLLPLAALDVFGTQVFSRYYGMQNVTFIVSALLGPVAAGQSFDRSGSYKNAFLGAGGIFGLGILSLYLSGRLDFPEMAYANPMENSSAQPGKTETEETNKIDLQ